MDTSSINMTTSTFFSAFGTEGSKKHLCSIIGSYLSAIFLKKLQMKTKFCFISVFLYFPRAFGFYLNCYTVIDLIVDKYLYTIVMYYMIHNYRPLIWFCMSNTIIEQPNKIRQKVTFCYTCTVKINAVVEKCG